MSKEPLGPFYPGPMPELPHWVYHIEFLVLVIILIAAIGYFDRRFKRLEKISNDQTDSIKFYMNLLNIRRGRYDGDFCSDSGRDESVLDWDLLNDCPTKAACRNDQKVPNKPVGEQE